MASLLCHWKSITQTFSLSAIDHGLAEMINKVTGLSYVDGQLSVTISGLIPGNQINSRGYFTAIVIGFIAVVIFQQMYAKEMDY